MIQKVTHLSCEYRINPLGIDIVQPRLSWQILADRRGAKQTAYQILAAKDESQQQIIWDSGKVPSPQSILVPYTGPELQSGQGVFWKVRIWDEKDSPTNFSDIARWEMGLLSAKAWQGKWIGGTLVGGPRATIPAPYLRKSFSLLQPAMSARLYVTAFGLYEASINGKRIGDFELTPGWTDYNHRVHYQTYDVTELLQEGDNVLGAILGDGWYCGHVEWRDRQLYGDRPKLLAQLNITQPDGNCLSIYSDASWRVAYGPLLQSDIIMGECYDARLEFPGWNIPGYDQEKSNTPWLPASTFTHPEGVALVAQNAPAIKSQETFTPISEPHEIPDWRGSRWVFDLGQNMTGRIRLKVSGSCGTNIRIRHAEVLNPDGTLYTENLRTARATDYYTLKSNEIETWEPKFTFHGFRYVELAGVGGKPGKDMVAGIVLHSDLAPTGEFNCSDPLLNQLQHNILWGWKGNIVDVPTDCPQRDERLGWTGDAANFCRTAAFLTNSAPFFAKWLQDLEDSQGGSGAIPMVAPTTWLDIERDGGPAWADAAVIIPWTIYQYYGDVRLLHERYGMMTRFMEYLVQTSPGLIRSNPDPADWTKLDDWRWGGFGDWLALDGSGKREGNTPKDLIGTAYLAYCSRLMAQIADLLGKDKDAEQYRQLFENTRQAFTNRFLSPDGLLTSSTQTSYVLALAFDLLPEKDRTRAAATLVRDILQRDKHLSTGFVGTPFLPFVLTEAGFLDIAYDLLFQKSWPSFLYAVTQGATTIWERWDGWTHDRGFQDPSMNSFNHYSYGAIGAWLYNVVAGMDSDIQQPGYRHIILHPRPGGGLTQTHAALESLYGHIESSWQIDNGKMIWNITIPPNTTATVWVPCVPDIEVLESNRPAGSMEGVTFLRREKKEAVYQLASGHYTFTSQP